MRKIIITRLGFINLPRAVCQWLLGEEHKLMHRMAAGTGVMIVGVGIAKAAHLTTAMPVQIAMDLMGYLIHGVGAVPFVEWLVNPGTAPQPAEEQKE